MPETEKPPEGEKQSQQGAQSQATPPALSEQDKALEAFWTTKVKPQFDKFEADLHRERTRTGRLASDLERVREASGWSEEEMKTFMDAYGRLDRDVDYWKRQGVPERVLRNARPGKLDETAEDFLATKGASAANGNGASVSADMKNQFEAWAKESGWSPPAKRAGAAEERLMAGAGSPVPASPNIQQAYAAYTAARTQEEKESALRAYQKARNGQ